MNRPNFFRYVFPSSGYRVTSTSATIWLKKTLPPPKYTRFFWNILPPTTALDNVIVKPARPDSTTRRAAAARLKSAFSRIKGLKEAGGALTKQKRKWDPKVRWITLPWLRMPFWELLFFFFCDDYDYDLRRYWWRGSTTIGGGFKDIIGIFLCRNLGEVVSNWTDALIFVPEWWYQPPTIEKNSDHFCWGMMWRMCTNKLLAPFLGTVIFFQADLHPNPATLGPKGCRFQTPATSMEKKEKSWPEHRYTHWKLTWNLKMSDKGDEPNLTTIIFRFHVKLGGCNTIALIDPESKHK